MILIYESVWRVFWEGGTCGILKQRRFKVPVNASEVIFGGVLHLFFSGFCSPSPTQLDSCSLIQHLVTWVLHRYNTSDLNRFSLA